MLLSRKTVRLYIELKVIVQRGAIGGPHLPHAHKLDAACFVSSRIADILHRAQSLLSWMPGELELDTASCIMVHRRTPRLLTQSTSWIRCYRLPCVLFDLSNKPWSLSVTLPPRLPDHQCSRVSQWNLKIGFYPSFDRCHKGNRLYRADLRAASNSDILIARPPVALITILIPVFIRDPVLMTTVTAIDTPRRRKCLVLFSDIKYTFFNYSHKKQTLANKTNVLLNRYVWGLSSRFSKNMLKIYIW